MTAMTADVGSGAKDTEDVKAVNDAKDAKDANRQWSRERSKNALRARQGNFYFLIFIEGRHMHFEEDVTRKIQKHFLTLPCRCM